MSNSMMRTPVTEYLAHQGGIIPTVTLSSSPGHSQSPSELPAEQATVLLSGNESPHSSPKHSPKQSIKSKENLKSEGNGREPSPFSSEKLDSDQQDAISRTSDSTQIDQSRYWAHERSGKERKESRASDRTKKKSWYNVMFATYKSRSEEFKKYFKEVPHYERLIVDYSCALQRDILIQGRLYITQNYLCFYANIFRWETCVCIKWKDVSSVTKEKTALVIPNAILVSTETEKLFFTTFAARDKAYVMLFRVWQNALMGRPLLTEELWQLIHAAYGDELGFSSEDEAYNYIPAGTNIEQKLDNDSVRLSSNSLSEEILSNNNAMQTAREALPTEAVSTDLSDNSSDSDAEANDEPKMKMCTSSHDGRLIVNMIIPVHVNELFQLLFTNSKFLVELHSLRRTTDFKASSWQRNAGTNEMIRTVSMVVSLGQSFGPKTSSVHETQILQSCSKHGKLYSIDGEVVNSGIPYADSFYVVKHYCLEKVSETETNLSVYAQIKYKKNVWSVMKNVIERTTWAGLNEFYGALVKSLLVECGDAITKSTKRRRSRRGLREKATVIPSTEIQIPPGSSSSGGQNVKFLLLAVLAILVFLLLLNGLLYYKLWALEDFTQTFKSSSLVTESGLLKDPPKTHEEWLQALKHQESIHRMEVDKWQEVLQFCDQLLRKTEESLNDLRGSIKVTDPNDNTAIFIKEKKQEL